MVRLAACMAAGAVAPASLGQLPVTGKPVPELSSFDGVMQDVMDEHDISAGVLAVSRDGRIIYQRGFGYLLGGFMTLPENATMRIASCEKPFTSAAVRMLVDTDVIEWDDFVFDLGQPGGGLLSYTPYDGLGDSRWADIRVEHVFRHRGGWDRDTADIGDPQFQALEIADELDVESPPGRDNIIRYMLSQPLQFAPGTNGCTNDDGNPTYCYSNFGYMVLGRIVEEHGDDALINFLRTRIVTPDQWVPGTEIYAGRTRAFQHGPREPEYQGGGLCLDVFNNGLANVPCPYGGWEIEAFAGHGNLVCSAVPMLRFMERFQVGVGGSAGTPLATPADANAGNHAGGMAGTTSVMLQRGDGINIVVLFNRREDDPNPASQAAGDVSDLIDVGGFTWPTFEVDGAWVDFASSSPGEYGSFTHPYRTMSNAVGGARDGTKLRFKPGVGAYSGTINEKLLLDAPLGAVRIGG